MLSPVLGMRVQMINGRQLIVLQRKPNPLCKVEQQDILGLPVGLVNWWPSLCLPGLLRENRVLSFTWTPAGQVLVVFTCCLIAYENSFYELSTRVVFYVASISAANVAFEDLTSGARSPGYNPQVCADWLYDPEPQFPHL